MSKPFENPNCVRHASDRGDSDPYPSAVSNPRRNWFTDPVERAAWEATEGAAGRFRMALMTGNKEELVAAWRQGLADLAEIRDAGQSIEDVPLSDLLSVKEASALEREHGAIFVRDLRRLTAGDVVTTPNFGVVAWGHLQQSIRERAERIEAARRAQEAKKEASGAEG